MTPLLDPFSASGSLAALFSSCLGGAGSDTQAVATVIPPGFSPAVTTEITLAALTSTQQQQNPQLQPDQQQQEQQRQLQQKQQQQHSQQQQQQNIQTARFLYPDQCLSLTQQGQQQQQQQHQQQQLEPQQQLSNLSAAPLFLQPTAVTSLSLTIPAGTPTFVQSSSLLSSTSDSSPPLSSSISSTSVSSSRHGSSASATLSLVSQALLEICEG